jgi:sugar phosphate isomerase/epimerase
MNPKNLKTRKEFIRDLSLIAGSTVFSGSLLARCKNLPGSQMKIGLVTYLWAKDWDIPAIIKNCTAAGLFGVELREQHAHGVTIELTAAQRAEVKKKFAGSPVTLIGLGTNQQYDYADPELLKASIERTKEWIKLSMDIGGSGVKVKPNEFHAEIPREKTIEQIGKALNELGKFALDNGQVIRLEVHGNETSELPYIKAMMDYVETKGTTVCWNSNASDLQGEGLEYNFNLVRDRLGDVAHIHELDSADYPYPELFRLFVGMDYKGWLLLECSSNPEDKVAAMIEQKTLFEKMVKEAQA